MDSNHPATLAAVDPNVGYYPHGAIRIMTLGNGLKATTAYDSRLQPCRINLNSSGTYLGACADSVPGGNVQDFSYGFGASNNGNVASWSATGTQSFTRSYTYDSLNRLGTYSSPSDASGCTGLSWTYDRWGNRTGQNVTGGTCGAPQFTFTNNRITNPGFQYDAAGNLTNDGSHSYSYDAENRLTAVDGGSTASFVYDAAGLRLLKTVGGATTTYVRDMDGNIVAEMNGGSWGRGSIFWDGRLLAQYWGGTTQFVFGDRLDSTRLLTSMNQSIYDSMDFLPYGELLSGGSSTYFKFTGYERDGESGKDYAFARYFGSNMGRFMSPDPLAGDASDPQSLNLYTYVRNNPANLIDPSGLCAESFWGGSCNDFGISITWGWGSGRDDDAPRPLHPHPTYPPSHTGPSPHVAYSFLPGETAGVPDWITGRSDLSRFIIQNFTRTSAGGQGGLLRSPIPIQILVIAFLERGKGFDLAMDDGKPKQPQKRPFKDYMVCMGAQVTGNLFGDDDRTFWTVGTFAAVVLKYGGTRAAAAVLPGPGWFYAGAMVAWDTYQVFDAWKTCRQR